MPEGAGGKEEVEVPKPEFSEPRLVRAFNLLDFLKFLLFFADIYIGG